MPITTHPKPCIEVWCDTPNCDLRSDSEVGVTLHFASPDEAFESVSLDGWRRLPDGTIQCPNCARRADCADRGHDWTTWSYVQALPGFPAFPPQLVRHCRHCLIGERTENLWSCQHELHGADGGPCPDCGIEMYQAYGIDAPTQG